MQSELADLGKWSARGLQPKLRYDIRAARSGFFNVFARQLTRSCMSGSISVLYVDYLCFHLINRCWLVTAKSFHIERRFEETEV